MTLPTRELFEDLGFERFDHPLSGHPAYRLSFGPHEVSAVVEFDKWFREAYMLSGVVKADRTVCQIAGELPLEVDNREEGLALISFFLAPCIPDALKPPWLRIGERMRFALPWNRAPSVKCDASPPKRTSESPKKVRDNLVTTSYPAASISLDLETTSDGAVELSGQDLGSAPMQAFGSDSYEYWVRLRPEALARLVHALLLEKYRGCATAVSDLRSFCEAHDVPHEYGTWPL